MCVFVVLLVLAVLTVSSVLARQRYDGLRINIAGRQRMLSQKLTKELLLFSMTGLAEDEVRATGELFDESLLVLIDGGAVPWPMHDHDMRRLPEMKDGPTRDQLQVVRTLWQKL